MQWKDCLTRPWVEVLTMAKRWVDVLTLTKAFAAVMLPVVENSLTNVVLVIAALQPIPAQWASLECGAVCANWPEQTW